MAERLGGEVGVERASAERSPFTRSSGGRPAPKRESQQKPSDQPFPWQQPRLQQRTPRYRDRVRMDFTAARVEHQQKTFLAALVSLVHPMVRIPDYISRRFVANELSPLVEHIERLVSATRHLLGYSRRLAWRLNRNPRTHAILVCLRDWEVERLRDLVTRLTERPRATFDELDELTRALYRPIIQMHGRADPDELRRAIELAFRERAMRLPKSSSQLTELRRSLSTASAEIDSVFDGIKHRCYPLLMKLATIRFRSADAFFDEALPEVMAFAGVADSDRVPEHGAEPPTEEETRAREGPASFVKSGLRLLNRMFPRAGWDRIDWREPQLSRAPDLYAYFACLLEYPQRMWMVPVADPVHAAVTLHLILGELFEALESVSFGQVPETKLPLGPAIEELVAAWARVPSQVVADDYLKKVDELTDLTRFGTTESIYAKRLAAEAREIRRRFLVPWTPASGEKQILLDGRSDYPVLDDITEQFADLLLRVAIDITEAAEHDGTPQSLPAPWEKPSVAVDNQVAARLRTVTRWNNANLLLSISAIMSVLDYLLNEAHESWASELNRIPLFRTEADGLTPAESVTTLDASTLMRLLDDPLATAAEIPGFLSKSVLPLALTEIAGESVTMGLLVVAVDGAAELWANSEEELIQTVQRLDALISGGIHASVRSRIARSAESMIYLCEPSVELRDARQVLDVVRRAGIGVRIGLIEQAASSLAPTAGGASEWIETLARALIGAATGSLVRYDPSGDRVYTDDNFR